MRARRMTATRKTILHGGEFQMNKVKILTDSCADLSGEILEKYGIDYARMSTVLDGKTTPASLTWEYYTPHELYETIRKGQRVTTTQVPVDEFQRIFELYLGEGYDIVYIGCSLKLSGSVNTARVVAGKLAETFPNQSVFCIDAKNSSAGEGLLAIYAATLAAEGKSAKEVADAVSEKRGNVLQYVAVQSLDCLRKAGRVKGSAAFFGNLFGVRPIIISDADGNNAPIKKVKGRVNSLKECVNLLKENAFDDGQPIYFVHADCQAEEVESIKTMIKEAFPKSEIIVGYIGPIVGACVGPDSVGLFAFGKEVTYRVEANA